MPIEKIIALLRYRLIVDLKTPGSDAFNLYETGLAQGEFDVVTELMNKAKSGDKDVCDVLNEIERTNELTKSIRENFRV